MSKTTKQAKSIKQPSPAKLATLTYPQARKRYPTFYDLQRQQHLATKRELKKFMAGKQWSKKDIAKLPKGCRPLVLNKTLTIDHYRKAIREPALSPMEKRLAMALQRKINLHASLLAVTESRLRALTMPPERHPLVPSAKPSLSRQLSGPPGSGMPIILVDSPKGKKGKHKRTSK